MIDSIKLFTTDTSIVDIKHLEDKYGFNTLNANNGYFSHSFKINNISIKIDNHGLHIEGSAPKYLNNNNVKTLKLNQILPFTTKLSEDLGFDVTGLTITKIDITDNIVLPNNTFIYKRYFGHCRYFQKIEYEYNGILYRNGTRSITIYDKTLEMLNTRVQIPDTYANLNLLRIEYGITKRVRDHLGDGIVTMHDLTTPENYLLLVDKWEYMFNQIHKISFQPTVAMPYVPGMHPREYYTIVGVQANGGITKTKADIEEGILLGHFTERVGKHHIDNIIEYQNKYSRLSDGAFTDRKEELISCFNQKVKENKNI